MPTAIEFENISKQYRLGLVSTRTLSHDLKRWYTMNIQGKDDPYLKIGEVNDRAHKGESEYVWALKDINFKVEQGDVLGIIGKNGAGKSTLLKILSKVTTPSTGIIKARGRIASLLEVGTGFHPEMTGRENIYMNGAIMGMTKAEISRKFDEIVDFSGVERYIDTPAKRYSSGMTVRLGFAIAAHLEPEILVVDEVLAVGDAEFQKKAIGKMQDVSKGEGRTVLFVSHNMGAVETLCTKGLVLNNGSSIFEGTAEEAVDYYINNNTTKIISLKSIFDDKALENENIRINKINIKPTKGDEITIESGVDFYVNFHVKRANINIALGITLFSVDDTKIFESNVILSQNNDSKIGQYTLSGKLSPYIINSGTYRVKIVFGQNQMYVLYKNDNLLTFEVGETFFDRGSNYAKVTGICRPNLNWELEF